MDTTTPQAAAAKRAGKYFVKCDYCRETMRWTDSMQESAAGGRCEKCKKEAWRVDFERRASWATGMES